MLSGPKAHVPGREAATELAILGCRSFSTVAGEFPVSGVGSQHPSILETRVEQSNTSLLLCSIQRG